MTKHWVTWETGVLLGAALSGLIMALGAYAAVNQERAAGEARAMSALAQCAAGGSR